MAAPPDDELIILSLLWGRLCEECGDPYYRHFAAARNEVVFDDEGNVLGIEGTFRYVKCGHLVKGLQPDPVRVAQRLEYREETD